MSREIIQEKYSLGKRLDVLTQLSLARELANALPTVEVLMDSENQNKDKTVLIVLILAQLNENNYRNVVKTCLAAVMRKQGDKLVRLQVEGNLMFDDLTLAEITELVAWVIEENLRDFMNTALSGLKS